MVEERTIQADISDDLVFGATAIARVLGMTRRQIYHAASQSHIPAFKIGNRLCARKTSLSSWLASLENSNSPHQSNGETPSAISSDQANSTDAK